MKKNEEIIAEVLDCITEPQKTTGGDEDFDNATALIMDEMPRPGSTSRLRESTIEQDDPSEVRMQIIREGTVLWENLSGNQAILLRQIGEGIERSGKNPTREAITAALRARIAQALEKDPIENTQEAIHAFAEKIFIDLITEPDVDAYRKDFN